MKRIAKFFRDTPEGVFWLSIFLIGVGVSIATYPGAAARRESMQREELSYGRDLHALWWVIDVGHRPASDGENERWFAWLSDGRQDVTIGGALAKEIYEAGKKRDDWVVVTYRQVWHREIDTAVCYQVRGVDTTKHGYEAVMAEIEHRSIYGAEIPWPIDAR